MIQWNPQSVRPADGQHVALATLWFGTYILHTLPNDHWAEFPTFITLMAFLVLAGGLVIAGAEDFDP